MPDLRHSLSTRRKTWMRPVHTLLTLLCLSFLLSQCGKEVEVKAPSRIDRAYTQFVSSYTGGVVSKNTSIQIQLLEAPETPPKVGNAVPAGTITLDPAVSGKAIWVSDKTIEFTPDAPLESGQAYTVKVNLGQLIDVPDKLKTFEYVLNTILPNFEISIDGLEALNEKDFEKQVLRGRIVTADMTEDAKVEALLTAKQEGSSLNIDWEHSEDGTTHSFVVEGITRRGEESTVRVNWDGDALNVKNEGEQEIKVPSLGDFTVTDIRLVQRPEQYISIRFSDPLLANQNLNGLITLSNRGDIKFVINGNEVRAYPSSRQAGTKTIRISEGVRNAKSAAMNMVYSTEITFEQQKPAVRLVTNGTILPNTQGMIMPFEAVNLNAVDVTVIRIYESNVMQFLQVNQMNGNYQLQRVGKPIVRKTVKLNSSGITDLSQWNRYSLDLSSLITAEPGAIYQVKIGFRQHQSTYSCGDDSAPEEGLDDLIEPEDWDFSIEDDSYWDAYEDDEYGYYYYDWSERDNPCHEAYYSGDRRTVKQNLFASDLGLIAKRSANGQLDVIVSDIITTKPLGGVAIEVFDFQQQALQSMVTDAEGMARVQLKGAPYFIKASFEGQNGYLRLNDGESLSLSNFDVGGTTIKKGLKGFLYGERGVWRPGDSLYLNFILEDQLGSLPADHPAVFELKDPNGQVRRRIVRNSAVEGIYNFSTDTDDDAPTGYWNASVKLGGVEFNKTIRIETVKPNRLKINLDFGKDKLTSEEPFVEGDLDVTWLHGAPASNLRAEFDVILSPTPTRFSKFSEYSFDDQARSYYSSQETFFDGRLDDKGHARISTTLDPNNDPPGKLMARFSGKVYEEGGNFSIDNFSIPFYPYSSFVGIKTPKGDARGMLLTDKDIDVDIAVVDAEGELNGSRQIEMEVYKVQWRWWWNNSGGGLSNYVGNSSHRVVDKQLVTTSNGRAKWSFQVKYPEWGRYYVRACDPNSGHCTGKIIYIDWPGWAGRQNRENPGGENILAFGTDKTEYSVGENVNLSIPGNAGARALISVESGSQVIDAWWLETQDGENNFSFATTEDMAPNVFVNVTMVQPHGQSKNDAPLRLYGISPIRVTDPATKLSPTLSMPEVIRPESEVTIKVGESDGKAMAYTVALVDEGLLDITRFGTPAPWEHFYAREAIGVKTWDVYEEVIGAMNGHLERLLSVGGGGEEGEEKKTKANRFKPVVKFFGPYTLQAGKTATHTFKMPQYIGSVRTMVVARSADAYGHTDVATPVRESLMVLGTLPRVLGPEEEVRLPVNVFALENNIRDVNITVKSNDLLELRGSKSKSVTFTETGDKTVYFDFKVKPNVGIATVEIEAKSGNHTARHSIELDVRNPNPYVTDIYNKVIEEGQSWSTTYKAVGMAGTNSGVLEVSNIPPIDMGRRLKYLIKYPHGCIEQTTSSVFPQLYLAEILDLDDAMKTKIQENITAGIERLRKFQTSDGGFAYWPGDVEASIWGSNYAGHFLLEAEAKGYHVPSDVMRKWKKFQRNKANDYRYNPANQEGYYKYNNGLQQSYRLYTLALANNSQTGAMNRLRETSNLPANARWRLAAAYAKAGQAEVARDIIRDMSLEVDNYRELSYSYGSTYRDKAMMLETLVLLDDREKGAVLLKQIAAKLSDKNWWMSTQETAYSLLAVAKFAGSAESDGQMKFTYTLNGGKAVNAATDMPISQTDLKITGAEDGKVTVQNTGKGVLFARLILEGQPTAGADQKVVEEDLRMSITYKDEEGNTINPARITQGTDFLAEVRITNPRTRGNYEEMAITQIFPSGWEIINTRLDGTESFYDSSKPEYRDIRDDRVLTYFDLPSSNYNNSHIKTFVVKLNATYVGRYYLPTVECEAMYDNSINARRPGQWVEVVSREQQ